MSELAENLQQVLAGHTYLGASLLGRTFRGECSCTWTGKAWPTYSCREDFVTEHRRHVVDELMEVLDA